jgi:hypothetical protein
MTDRMEPNRPDAPVDPAALRAKALADWQQIRYGDTDATRAALAYYRERGWRVDDPNFTRDTDVIEDRIYAFTSGYEAAHAALLSERDALVAALRRIVELPAKGRPSGQMRDIARTALKAPAPPAPEGP